MVDPQDRAGTRITLRGSVIAIAAFAWKTDYYQTFPVVLRHLAANGAVAAQQFMTLCLNRRGEGHREIERMLGGAGSPGDPASNGWVVAGVKCEADHRCPLRLPSLASRFAALRQLDQQLNFFLLRVGGVEHEEFNRLS